MRCRYCFRVIHCPFGVWRRRDTDSAACPQSPTYRHEP